MDERTKVDVTIAGAGTAGLALATGLARALKPNFTVAVCYPALGAEPRPDDRVSAIAGGARRLLTALGAWERLAGPVQPILSMDITDSRLEDAVRPTFLSFDAADEPAAHMVENRDVLVALRAVARDAGVQFVAAAGSVHTIDDCLPAKGRIANGPPARKCCTALPSCSRSWPMVATIPDWP